MDSFTTATCGVGSRALAIATVLGMTCGAAARADAQQADSWEFSVAPYVWATAVDGDMTVGPRTVPIFLKFEDAADNLAGAFAFHVEGSRGRWGAFSDVNFIRLSSSSEFTVLGRTVEGDFDLDNLIFEAGGSFLLHEPSRVGVIGGLRTYTIAPTVEFRTPNAGATPIDTSETSANAFVGLVARPRINDRWTFIARGDIGGGEADFTWSALIGFEVRIMSWGGIEFGYKGFGIDISQEDDDRLVSEYQVTHYGPIAGFRFHWGR